MSQHAAGRTIDDLCRPCGSVRRHTILAADEATGKLRVLCDFCGSQHNYRGGERAAERAARPAASGERAAPVAREAFPLVSERERTGPPMSHPEAGTTGDLELLLRRVLREELGLTPVEPADKWRGGELVLRPGRPGVQEKSWPIETFFHKVVMLRNRLRVLEQQINGSELPEEQKLKLQGYVTGCYGSLTSFNVLFADEADRFRGAGGPD